MLKTATITSKRQLTIPVSIFDELNLVNVRTMTVEKKNNTLVLTPVQNILNSLEGSVTPPDRYKNMSVDEIIDTSKKEYFSQKSQ